MMLRTTNIKLDFYLSLKFLVTLVVAMQQSLCFF